MIDYNQEQFQIRQRLRESNLRVIHADQEQVVLDDPDRNVVWQVTAVVRNGQPQMHYAPAPTVVR